MLTRRYQNRTWFVRTHRPPVLADDAARQSSTRYQIFISYSNECAGICDDVRRILEDRMGFAGEVFIDRHRIPGGTKWLAEIEDALDQAQYVLLLATEEAVRRPEWVKRELAAAQARETLADPEKQLKIIPIEFDEGASTVLLGDNSRQRIKAMRDGDSCADPEKLEQHLRAALLHRSPRLARALINLEEHRKDAQAWVDDNLPSPSFWENIWDGFISGAQAVAIVAPGGRGKTVIAAHYVDRVLRRQKTYPVVVRPEVLDQGIDAFAHHLGALDAADFPGHMTALQNDFGIRVFFIVDGLDQA
ncbi:TIR domain-containing protein [Sphaerisporangium sp. B11E5]|uniref:toll/interleukin-1 receptor domain-containing protein n=1 Tax=Sphaerisporangium sp. B11E5 TaxID=3153563 RepID=UPI00325E2AA7